MCAEETRRHSGTRRNPVEKILYWEWASLQTISGLFSANVTGKLQLQIFQKLCGLILLLCFMRTATATPDIQHWLTEQGVRVYFVEAHEIPMITVKVLFDAGSSRDADLPGVAMLTNALLGEGADGLSADQISRNFENLGASFSSGADRDYAFVKLQSLNDPVSLEKVAENLRRVMSRPDFPAAALERERGRTLTGLQQKLQSPGDLSIDAFYAAIYGEHPYAHAPEGTEESVKAITHNDILDFYHRYYTAKNAVVALVGDLDRVQADKFVATLFADLPGGARAQELPEVPALNGANTITIEHPSTQTHVLVGQPGIRRDDPDLFPLYVGNNILGGGGMSSRLFEEIRENRGLSYNTYSYFLPMRQVGPFISGLQTRNDQTEEALQVLEQQLQDFIDNGPTESELQATQKYLTGGFPLRIDSNKDIVEYLAMIGFYGLPLDYLDTYMQKIMSVTVEQIQHAFRQKLSPGRMVTVLVGTSVKDPE